MRRPRPSLAPGVLVIAMLIMAARPATATVPLSPSLTYAKGALAAQSLLTEYVAANRGTQALAHEQAAYWQSERGRSLLAAVTFLHQASARLGLPLQRVDEALSFAKAHRRVLAQQKDGKGFLAQLAAAEAQSPASFSKLWPIEAGLRHFLEDNVAALSATGWDCASAQSHDTAESYACQLRFAWERGDTAQMMAAINDPGLRTQAASQTTTALLLALNSLSLEKDTDALGILFDLQERQDNYRVFYDVAQRIQAARQRGQSEALLK